MIKKFIFFVGLISLLQCRSDILTINSEQTELSQSTTTSQKRFSTSFVSENGLEQDLTNVNLKSELKKSVNEIMQKEFASSKNQNYSIYKKIYDSLKETTTYSLTLIEYSEKHPYFLKNIITVKNGVEKMGFLKIIPSSKPGVNKEVLYNLTGVIQILDYNMNIISEDTFLNGTPQNTNKNSSTSTTGRAGCTTSVSIVAVNCTAGGNHSPGDVCSGNSSEQPYYEIISTTSCTGPVNEYLSAPDNPVVNGSGGSGVNVISKLLNNPKFNYSDFLLGVNKMDLLNFVANYINLNDPSSSGYYNEIDDSIISQLNQILSLFANTNELFENFDSFQNLLMNQNHYLQGVGTHYELRTYNLIKYLFEHPTQANANFISWASQFLIQNTLPNGTCTISWTEFENWFLNPSLSDNLIDELRNDWENPNIVKPTARFKNNAKLNSIYNKAKTAANFQQYLKNFEPTFSVAHLKFDIGTVVNSSAVAETKEPINYWVDITFNQNWDYPNTPQIVIAYTFMHEMIHAEMFRKLLSISSTPQGNIDWNEIKNLLNTHNYPGLFDYYTRYLASDSELDHQIIGAHYITIIVNYLKQVYGTKYTDVEYKTIAWSGLRGSKAWKGLPANERQLYIDTWNAKYWLWEK